MVPRRGGGGSSSSGSSDLSVCESKDGGIYPCSDGLYYMYGDIEGPLYSQSDLYGQLIVYTIWSLTLAVLLSLSLKRCARLFQLAMVCLFIAFAFQCARYGLLITSSDVPIVYRYESSIVVLFGKIGMMGLLAAALPSSIKGFYRVVLWASLAVYAPLNIAYVVYDFILSSIPIEEFKMSPYVYRWKLTDRDIGLTLTQTMMDALGNNEARLDSFFIQEKMYDVTSGAFHEQRSTQIKIGVAADYVAAALALYVLAIAALTMASRKQEKSSDSKWLILAGIGLFLSTVFRAVVSTAFVLRNWNDIRKIEERLRDFMSLDLELLTLDYFFREERGRFLGTYNVTINGYPVVQAVLEPFGLIVACMAMVLWWRGTVKVAR